MADPLFSPSWYRVADLKPRLRAHVEIHRHDYRGQIWYIFQDHHGGRSHRLSPAAYRIVALMDGNRTVQQLWDIANEQATDEAPTQDEIIRLLGQLHAADALICDVPPDGLELFRRFQRHSGQRWRQKLWSPLAVRIPVFDPDRFLDWSLPAVRPLFSWAGALVWVAVVAAGAVLAGVHWGALTENIVDRALTPQNLLVLWLVYPFVKALHELGHGYAVKVNGGEVHDIGIMLLVLIPVPYVDASESIGFRSKRQRMLVGAMGILVELFLGAIALFVWLAAEPGPVHAVAYNVMLISGVSTLLFNGNPLLRFDGYYVLADALEIPNLGTRANRHIGYVAQKYLLGSSDAEPVANSPGERFWLFTYGVAGCVYRVFILFVIILYIGSKYFVVGVALAIWATITQAIVPVAKGLNYLLSSPSLHNRRERAIWRTALCAGVVLTVLFAVPAPFWLSAEGVTWPAERSQIRAGTDGFVTRILARNGDEVKPGQPLFHMEDPFLDGQVAVLEAHVRGLRRQLISALATDRVQARILRAELEAVRANLARAREKRANLVVRSKRAGTFLIQNEQDLPGRFVRKGQLVGYVIDLDDELSARVVVPQDDISLVRDRTEDVAIMAADWGADPIETRILRQVPGGTNQLPARPLGTTGGGLVALDPTDPQGRRTIERIFELEVLIPAGARTGYLGQRVFVKFDLGFEPLGLQIYRALSQLFLKLFSV